MSNERFDIDINALNKMEIKLLYISTSKYDGEWPSLPHTHPFTELFYVVGGKGNFLVGEEIITVKEHDLMIVNSNVEHTEMSLDANPLEYIVFGVEGVEFSFQAEDEEQNYGYYNYSGGRNYLTDFCRILLREIQEKQVGWELVCHDILETLLIYISRNYKLGIIPSSPTPKMAKECAAAKRYLDTNYYLNITLDSLAEATHISKYYLVHSFSECFGLSPINYLIQKRLQISKELLSSTNHSIAQITSSTGFSSQSYFSQIFRKNTGMSPKQYRQMQKNSNNIEGDNEHE